MMRRLLNKALAAFGVLLAAILASVIVGGSAWALISSGALPLQAGTASGITFNTNGANTRGVITSLGSFVFNNGAISTNATDGFLYVPNSAGIPSGTPTTVNGVPFEIDSTNNQPYIYTNGAWHAVGTGGNAALDATWQGTFKAALTSAVVPAAGHYVQCMDKNWWNSIYSCDPSSEGSWVSSGQIIENTSTNGDNTQSAAVLRMDSTTTANSNFSTVSLSSSSANGFPTLIGQNTAHWGFCGHFRVPTAINATTTVRYGLGTSDRVAIVATIGVTGSLSTTKYVAQVSGAGTTNITSTVSIDTGWHTCCYVNDGTNSKLSCDNETYVTGTLQAPTSTKGNSMFLQAANGASAVSRQLDIDEMLLCWQSN